MVILAILAAILFPVFARGKERSKLTTCGTRLRQFAVALNLYRNDHEGLGYRWAVDIDHYRYTYPYNQFEPMKAYLGDGLGLWCLEPNPDTVTARNAYSYRTWNTQVLTDTIRTTAHRPFKPVPGSVLAFCGNHTEGEFDPRYAAHRDLRVGSYPFVREDTSFGIARSEEIRVAYYSEKGWFEEPKWPRLAILRFPKEPWPPEPEE